jgi:O-succinylbenzoic acid--CoA ligase
VKGLTLFEGFIRSRRIYLPVDKNGWYHTGDLGRLDLRGNLVVRGRRDNMFICGGENIYPEEIEQHLKNIRQVQDALVVPVADTEFGQRPAAFIKFKKGKKIGAENLKTSLAAKIARYKIPISYFSWPQNHTNLKPQRKKYINIAQQQVDKLNAEKNSSVKNK